MMLDGMEIIGQNRDEVRFRVPRDEVSDISRHLLEKLPVTDLGIEEVDVAVVIEQMFAEKS